MIISWICPVAKQKDEQELLTGDLNHFPFPCKQPKQKHINDHSFEKKT